MSPFSCCSITQLCLTLCDPMDCNTPGFPVFYHLPELAQTHVHWAGNVIQPSVLSSPSPTFSLSQHQGLFQWVSSLHQMATVLELQFQHQSFRVDFFHFSTIFLSIICLVFFPTILLATCVLLRFWASVSLVNSWRKLQLLLHITSVFPSYYLLDPFDTVLSISLIFVAVCLKEYLSSL